MFRKLIPVLIEFLTMVHENQVGAIPIKSIDAATSKWNNNASAAGAEYAANAVAAADRWQRQAAGSGQNWHQAVTSGNVMQRFVRGVNKAGAGKYSRKVDSVGAGRYSGGITAAVDDYKAGAQPYFDTIAGLTLTPRKPRGDPGNIQRVSQVATALNQKRLAMLGGGG